MLENLRMSDDVQDEVDQLGGGGVLDTALYDMTIEMAYLTKSKGGAHAINLQFKTDDKKYLRSTIYITNKEGKPYYEKDGKKNYLPGFLLATNLCLLTIKKEIADIAPEEKVIPIYDYDAKKELPTKMPVLVDLIGQRVTAGVIKEIVDKTKDTGTTDAAGNKVYAPTGETREQNEIDKFFRISDGFTVPEIRAKEPEAKFKKAWGDKHTGVTRNKSKGVTAGAAGALKPATAAAPKKSLFED